MFFPVILPALRSDPLEASHVRTQRLRDDDASVGLLIVLQNRDHGAAHGQSGAVQGMDEFHFAAVFPAEADRRPPGLEILKVAA